MRNQFRRKKNISDGHAQTWPAWKNSVRSDKEIEYWFTEGRPQGWRELPVLGACLVLQYLPCAAVLTWYVNTYPGTFACQLVASYPNSAQRARPNFNIRYQSKCFAESFAGRYDCLDLASILNTLGDWCSKRKVEGRYLNSNWHTLFWK